MSSLTNTFRTLFGYLSTLITRFTPLDLSKRSLDGIFNFFPISESIITSGQPTEVQLRLVRDAGYQNVINLAPHEAENALVDEAGTLASLGVEYTHIPVDFARPTEEDFGRFCEAMERIGAAPVLVHCAANMRVSAFLFRYRRDVLGEDPEDLRKDLNRIWEPFGVWKSFIAPRSDSSWTKAPSNE